MSRCPTLCDIVATKPVCFWTWQDACIVYNKDVKRPTATYLRWCVWLGACLGLLSCNPTSLVTACEERWCPATTVCHHGACVGVGELTACSGVAEGGACELDGAAGICRDGVCLQSRCGNSRLESGEACDDGNRKSGDGCSSDCLSTEVCGNGILDDAEGCDCGGVAGVLNPRCASPNSDDVTAECSLTCQSRECGDGVRNGLEDCDGRDLGGATCASTGLYSGTLACRGNCRFDVTGCERCGDGVVNGPEQCDGTAVGQCAEFGYAFGTTGCSAFCTPTFESCAASDWRTVATASATRLNGGWTFAGGAYIAGLDASVKLEGERPTIIPDIANALAVDGASPTEAYFVRRDGQVQRYDGQTATMLPPPGPSRLRAVYVAGPNDVFVGGGERGGAGAIARWNGTSWQAVPLPSNAKRIYALRGTSATNVWAGTESGQVFQYNGATWSVRASVGSAVRSMIIQPSGRVWFATVNGKVFRLSGSQFIQSGSLQSERATLAQDGDELYLLVGSFSYRWDGRAWQQFISEVPFYPRNFVAGHGAVWVTGPGGKLASLQQYYWHRLADNIGTPSYTAAWRAPSGELFTVGDGGRLQHYTATGWSSFIAPNADRFVAVWGTAANNVFAVGRANTGGSGRVYRFDGTTWTNILEVPEVSFHTVTGVDAAHVYVGDSEGNVRMFNGASWTVEAVTATRRIYHIEAIAPIDLYVAGWGGVRHFNGVTWTDMTPPDTLGVVRAMAVRAPDDIWIYARLNGNAYRQHWDGATWSAREAVVGGYRGIAKFGDRGLLAVRRYGGGSVFENGTWTELRMPSNEAQSEVLDVTQLESNAWLLSSNWNASVLRRR